MDGWREGWRKGVIQYKSVAIGNLVREIQSGNYDVYLNLIQGIIISHHGFLGNSGVSQAPLF